MILRNTITFGYLLGNFQELLMNLSSDHASTFENTLRKLNRRLQECSPHFIAGELKQLYLISINPEQFFQIIQEDTNEIQNHIEMIENYINVCKVDENQKIKTTYILIKDSFKTLLETVNYLKTIANYPGKLSQAPPGIKPHFNRFLNPGELYKLRDLLIKYGLISPQTLLGTIEYVFYGKGCSINWQPIIWLKNVSDLAYFVEMFFGITDQKTKWKTTHFCFHNTENQKFNYNSLRGKQYNYLSRKHSITLQTIDQIRSLIK